MAYNRYKWYSKFRKKKTLKESEPLLLRIRNGDFQYSRYLREVKVVEREYQEKYEESWDSNPQADYHERHHLAHQNARMRNVARLKLEEEGMKDELKILNKLRDGLEDEFGEDHWDEATSPELGLETIEDVYWFYKEKTGMGNTPSEIAIALKRNTTKGLK